MILSTSCDGTSAIIELFVIDFDGKFVVIRFQQREAYTDKVSVYISSISLQLRKINTRLIIAYGICDKFKNPKFTRIKTYKYTKNLQLNNHLK